MRTLVIAPHPDDETLGCGGTLLRRKSEGGELGWLIVTGISEQNGWSTEQVQLRDVEIERVSEMIGFSDVHNLRLPTTCLDTLPMKDLIEQFSAVFNKFQPEEVLLPHRSDVHTDHRLVFDAALACTKWFRFPSVRKVLAYETLSETEFGLEPESCFKPNYFVDISKFLNGKIELMSVYSSEIGNFPFPRSIEGIRALATYRGTSSGFHAAEAYQLLRQRS
jgi:N-acetylglucosamine malate deacetylase 1